MKKKGKFDYILLETTGLADPAPIASMFWLDEQLQSDLYLDGIVTVIDSKYAHIQSNEKKHDKLNEWVQQIALSDRIIMNKIDLVKEEDMKELQVEINKINSIAPIFKSVRSKYGCRF